MLWGKRRPKDGVTLQIYLVSPKKRVIVRFSLRSSIQRNLLMYVKSTLLVIPMNLVISRGEILHLLCLRSLSLLRSRCRNPPSPSACDLHILLCIITFPLNALQWVKPLGWWYCLNVGLDSTTASSSHAHCFQNLCCGALSYTSHH